MVWFGKKSGDEENRKDVDTDLSSNQKAEAEEGREKMLQEIDKQITVVLPIIRSE